MLRYNVRILLRGPHRTLTERTHLNRYWLESGDGHIRRRTELNVGKHRRPYPDRHKLAAEVNSIGCTLVTEKCGLQVGIERPIAEPNAKVGFGEIRTGHSDERSSIKGKRRA